jgi:hypothetical protein
MFQSQVRVGKPKGWNLLTAIHTVFRLKRFCAALTRRRYPEAREECWHAYNGDVYAGTIAIPTAPDERISWLKMLVMGFQVAYGTDAEIEIKKKEAAN